MSSVPFLCTKDPLPCDPSHAIRLLIILAAASLMPLISWFLPAGLPYLGILGTVLPLALLVVIVLRAPSHSRVRARFDTAYAADLLLMTLVLSSILPGFAVLLLLVLMHKTLSAILPQPVQTLLSILARIAFGTHLALATLIQLLLAWPTSAPRPRWSLIPSTLPYPANFVPRCLVPRAPPIQ